MAAQILFLSCATKRNRPQQGLDAIPGILKIFFLDNKGPRKVITGHIWAFIISPTPFWWVSRSVRAFPKGWNWWSWPCRFHFPTFSAHSKGGRLHTAHPCPGSMPSSHWGYTLTAGTISRFKSSRETLLFLIFDEKLSENPAFWRKAKGLSIPLA